MSAEWKQDAEYLEWLNNPTYQKYIGLHESIERNRNHIIWYENDIKRYIGESEGLRDVFRGIEPDTLPNMFAKLKEYDTKLGECDKEIKRLELECVEMETLMASMGDELMGLGYRLFGGAFQIPDDVIDRAMERTTKKEERGGVVEYGGRIMLESQYREIQKNKKWWEFWR